MSTAHRIAYDLFKAEASRISAVNAEHIYVDASPLIVNLKSVGVETRTLDVPTRQAAIVCLHMQTDGGDITVTVTGGYNETGDTTFVFSDEGQVLWLQSFMTKAGVYFWRKISDYGLGNVPATAATVAPVAGVAAGYKIARGVHTQVAASDTVVTGLATVVAVVAQFSSNPTVKQFMVAATIGDQAGTPAAGSVLIKTFKPTNNTNDSTPTAATDFTDNLGIAWIAVGT